MARYNFVIQILSLLILTTATAPAQQATLMVSATVLPAPSYYADASSAPSLATGRTMVASAKIDAVPAAVSAVSRTTASDRSVPRVVARGNDWVEFSVAVSVASNVTYQILVAATGAVAQVEVRDVAGRFVPVGRTALRLHSGSLSNRGGRQEIQYRVPADSAAAALSALDITLSASSIL